jgi:O-antigen/teichoic acid export membrane protein
MYKVFFGFLNGKLFRASGLLVFVGIAAGLMGYLFQVAMGRLLSPADYGLFSALMAIFMILVSPLQTLTMLVSRKVAEYAAADQKVHIEYFYREITIRSIQWSLYGVAALYLLSPFVMDYLKTDNIGHVFVLGLLVLMTVPSAIAMGFTQGLHRFRALAGAQFFLSFTKVIFAVVLVSLGFGVTGAVFGVVLSTAVTAYWLNNYLSMPLYYRAALTGVGKSLTFRKSAPVFVANSAFTAMTYMDIVFVNYYFSATESGAYAAAAILGKAVMFLPAGISQAMYPMVVTLHTKRERDISVLFHALGLVMVLSLIGGMIYYFFSDFVVSLLFGAGYSSSAEILKYYGFAILPLTLIMVAEHYLIAKSRVLFAYLFGGALPFQLLAVHFFHDTVMSIVMIMAGTGLVVSLLGFIILWRHYRKGLL